MDKAGAIFALLTVVTVMTGSWFIAGVYITMTTEQIKYETVHELGDGVEIRHYEEMTLVSTQAKDTGRAFSRLAAYISGSNKEDVQISMTAPVLSFRDGSTVNLSFVLPDPYDSSNSPAPENDAISIDTIPARKIAVIGFSGYVNEDEIEKNRNSLKSILEENNIVTKGKFFLMRYNPPWVPPALMHNEVAIEVE